MLYPCADCEDCTDLTAPTNDFTEQCTDKCVVIACTDPNHGEMDCTSPTDGHAQCDLDCDSAVDCAHCNGFDAFLQCCTDYHAYFSEPVRDPVRDWGDLDDLLCACGQLTSDQNSSPADNNPHHPSSGGSRLNYEPSSSQSSRSPTIQPSEPMLRCRWGECHALFSSLTELVSHVNVQHLHLPSASTDYPPAMKAPHPSLQDNTLSCLWRDCDIYPSPESIPGPSLGDPSNSALSLLASHLLQDHLGLSGMRYIPNATPISPSSPHSKSPGDDSSRNSPHASDSAHNLTSSIGEGHQHNCSGEKHGCRWALCGHVFDSCDDLTAHIAAVHIGSGKTHYECFWDGCNRNGERGFGSKQKISRHLQTHTGHRPFQCDICQQNFSEAATLQQHMRRHTQEKPYVCDHPGCGKPFAIAGALTIHKRTHNGDKPFKCTFCDRAFSESSNLSKHLRTHTGARPYACTEQGCTKCFARPDQLTRHMRVHRKKDPIDEAMQ